MSSRLTLSPDQLDRLEDALEDLEFGPEPDFDLDDPVDQQLSEFRDLLVLSREAMPLEDVPAGLLDGVLAEARQAAAAAPAATEGESFWSRFRLGTWLPTLAFAGSAAALLVVLLPQTGSEPPAADSSTVARADANEKNQPVTLSLQGDELAEAIEQAQAGKDEFSDDATARGQGVVIGERAPATSTPTQAPAAEPESEPEPVADEEWDEEATADDEVSSKRRTSGKKADAKPMPTKPAPKPKGKKPSPGAAIGGSSSGKGGGGAFPQTPAPSKKSEEPPADLWTDVLEGDKLRHRGNCGLARMRYDKARKQSDEARVRGRSLAGLGLCEYAAGNKGKAKKLFEQARAAHPPVGSFIDQELARLDLGREPDAAAEADQTKD